MFFYINDKNTLKSLIYPYKIDSVYHTHRKTHCRINVNKTKLVTKLPHVYKSISK